MLKRMRAVVITRPGGPEVLEFRDISDPSYGPEHVVVAIRATALNRADLLQRRGLYPAPPDAPADIPGLEFAGEVESCGARVRSLRTGDRVMGILGGGGHAEKTALHERLCMPIPPTLSWEEAAAIPEAYLTAYDALFRRAGLSRGEAVLVQAAGSGVGTAAVQLAASAGARVIGLSRTSDKRSRLEGAGPELVLDPSSPDAAERIMEQTDGVGVDVVIDLVGAAAWPLHARVLRECGRLVMIGLMGGARCNIDLALVLSKRLTLAGSVLRSRPLEEKIELVQEFSQRILPQFADGRLEPWIDRALSLSQVAEAHAVMERNENLGKIVMTIDRS
jgi:putative PIG3 family NAD(P)H quinone oxidoreductase